MHDEQLQLTEAGDLDRNDVLDLPALALEFEHCRQEFTLVHLDELELLVPAAVEASEAAHKKGARRPQF